MSHLLEMSMSSNWILIVFALLTYGPTSIKTRVNQFYLFGNGTSVSDDSKSDKFHEFNFTNFTYRWKSTRKCQEYYQAVEQAKWILPLSDLGPIRISFGCAISINPLIFGGQITQPNEFPHMAAIGWILKDRSIGYHCGGSLISDQWILTAAHCTHGPLGKPIFVRLGSNNLSDERSGKLIKIKTIKKHPYYSPPSMYADLALLKLTETVSFDMSIKPACLDTDFDSSPSQLWATGWGLRNFVDDLSDVLVKVKLEVIDNIRCAFLHNFTMLVPRGIVPSMICAGDPDGGWKKDTCHGDSGGPIQAPLPNKCLYKIVGITSFGKSCATPNLPGVYTRVSHYVEWIESIVWPEDD